MTVFKLLIVVALLFALLVALPTQAQEQKSEITNLRASKRNSASQSRKQSYNLYESNSKNRRRLQNRLKPQGRGKGGKGKAKAKIGAKAAAQMKGLENYANSLDPTKDYNSSSWKVMFHSRSPQDFFDNYLRKLSSIFEESGALVNFVMVGACDGVTDPTIKRRFLKYEHWRGVFVEPVSMNFRDLEKYLIENGAADRSYMLRAAMTDKCTSATIKMERPMYEEKNASLPHWMRRQIGSILPEHRDHPRKEWVIEEVRCVTAADVLTEWALVTRNRTTKARPKQMAAGGRSIKKRRPHVLKIDVEGHDFQVLMSFLGDEIPINELPLMVDFEAKSISKLFPTAKAHMEKRGYVVSDFGQDGFALLRGDVILNGMKRNSKDSIESEDTEVDAEATEGQGDLFEVM